MAGWQLVDRGLGRQGELQPLAREAEDSHLAGHVEIYMIVCTNILFGFMH